MHQRRRDGRGRGTCLDPRTGADIADGGTNAVIEPAPIAHVSSDAPAGVSRARTVAVVAKPEACIACGTCVETCPRDAITLEETAVIDPDACTGCGMCVDDCSYGALALSEV
jgi:ferredoxin